jgi:ABC-2 type transport system permease protein
MALLVSWLVEGEYTAPMVSLGVIIAWGNAPKSWHFLNPLAFVGGRDYMGPSNMLIGPIPWTQFAAYVCVGALLIVASIRVTEKRDF